MRFSLRLLSDDREGEKGRRRRKSPSRRAPWAVATMLALVLGSLVAPAMPAVAAPGDPAQLYLGPSYEGTTIGSDKDFNAPTECPANSLLTGVQTENRQNVSPTNANSILVRMSLQCATITVSNAGAITPVVNPTWITGPTFDEGRGDLQTAVCPANTYVHRITGTTFVGDGTNRWPSSVQITCRPLVFTAAGELRIDLSATPTVLTAGENLNTTGGLDTPAPQCGPGGTTGTSDILVRGYRAQGGGEGIDGFTPSCTTIADDFGDAPASYGSVSQELNAATYLGWSADAETAMQSNGSATGDDAVGGTAPNQTIDDETAVSAFGEIIAGVTDSYSVSVLASNKLSGVPATLVGWVDFNRNGVFDANEGASVVVPAGTPDGSSFTLTWSGIAPQTVAGQTFARFRIGAGSTLTTSTPTGTGGPGEVEDYALSITAAAPVLELTKTASPTTIAAAGQTVTYSFAVANTGNVAISDIGITETSFSGTGTLGPITCAATALAVGESTTCTATYAPTQADVDAGTITNSALATGTSAAGSGVESNVSSAVVTASQSTSLTVVKSATPSGPDDFVVGQVIDYSFVVTNTGNVTVTNVSIDETAFDGSGSLSPAVCPTTPLAPGAQVTCTASYTLTQADVDNGSVSNTATATGVPPGSLVPPVSPPSTVRVPVDPAPAITLAKSADTTAITEAGQVIAYSFLVTNTGNVTLTDVTVDEGAFTGTGPLEVTCPAGAASLAPGAQVTCTADYTVTAADYNTAALTNTATATGTPPDGTPPVSPPSTVEIPVTPAPALTVAKTADRSEITTAGQTITYSFLLTNTGNVTLTDVGVDEVSFSGTGTPPVVTCPAGAASLAPGDTVTCTAPYVVTQADIDAGQLTNTATGTGNPPGGGEPPVSPPSTVVVPAIESPAITVVKSADPATVATVGTPITYSFLVTNTGNVTLTDVTVTETAFTGTGTAPAITCPAGAASLAPSAQITCTATYTTTQADIDAGQITNTATATGTPPGEIEPPVSPPSTAIVTVPPAPSLTVAKTADRTEITAAGQTITYSFLITNTGNVTLTDVGVTEVTFTGTGTAPVVTCPAGAASLAPGATVTCTAPYVVTQEDVDAGGVTNTATVTGDPPGPGTPPVSPPSTVVVPSIESPGITVVKSASPNTAADYDVGQEITYSFVVTNTGNVTLTDVTVDETAFSGSGDLSPITCPAGAASLAPGAQVTCTASYTLTQADVDAGRLTNTATATGTPPSGEPPVSPPSTVELPGDPEPGLSVVKSADRATITAAGQTITYSFLVTNTGNVTITDATVTETAFTGTGTPPVVECPAGIASMAPGAQVTCTAEYVVTQADLDAGQITNAATVTGNPPGGGEPPVSPPSTVVVPGERTPAISLVKSASPDSPDTYEVGQEVTYSFVVTNTGNVTLTDVTVEEGSFSGTGTLSAIDCPAGAASMTPGAQVICTATYELTQADIDAGQVTNTATATGVPPGDLEPPVSPPAEARVPALPAPGLSIVKSATPAAMTTVGQVLQYNFVVTNTGNVTLTDVAIDEGEFSGTGDLSPVDCPAEASSMLPGQTVTCTASYTTTQADVDSGALTNTATATGDPPGEGEPPVSPPSTVRVPFEGTNGLDIEKRAIAVDVNGNGRTDLGDRVEWTIIVTNIGAQTVDDIAVTDPTAGPVTCPATSLASGAQMTCTVPPHTIDEDDVRRGGVRNVATVTGNTPGGPIDPPSSEVFTRVLPPPPTGLAVTGGTLSAGGLLLGGVMVLAGLGLGLTRGVRRRDQEQQ